MSENDYRNDKLKDDVFIPSSRMSGKSTTSSASKTSTKVATKSTAKKPTKKGATTSKSNKKKGKKKKHRIIRGIFKTIFILILLMITAGLGFFVAFTLAMQNEIGGVPDEAFEINNFTTYIYDKNGNEYTRLDGAENRTYASLSNISPYLPKAFVSIEDERFYEHKGVDVKRTLAAVYKYFLGDADFGGSTITQQVIKKVTGEDERSSTRKAKEIIRAFQLEKKFKKDEIIELYMNLIYLGEGTYGVEAASFTYFNKSAKDLDIAECALIAGLAQLPEVYNPYKNPEKAKARQELVLGKMLELGYITEAQYADAMKEELVYSKGTITLASSNSYFIDALVEQLIKDIMNEKGVTRLVAQKMVYNNGFKIYTTLDPEIQNILEKKYKDTKYFHTRKAGGYDKDIQSAMVIIDYKTGEVPGLIGGAGEKDTLRGLNRATGMTRSPGSNIKPIGVYGPALELGLITAASTFDDVPTTFKLVGGGTWSPKNYDRRYRGLLSIRKALELSQNVVAAKVMMDRLGTVNSYDFLKKFGITSLATTDLSSPAALSLGSMRWGVSPYELCAAYGTIANKGVYIEPKLYTKILDRKNQVFYEKKSAVRDVLSEQNAYILTDMMLNVTTGSEGTGRAARISGYDVAAKTGTTSDDKDRWFSGFTPYYVGSVWYGYDQPEYINVSTNPGVTMWHDVMEEIHSVKNLPKAKFERPSEGLVEKWVCRDSGLLMTEACKNDQRGNRGIKEIFTEKNAPTKYCDIHEYVDVCPDTFKLMTDACRSQVHSIPISFINRHYTKEPSVKPWDYTYEVPKTYCDFHTEIIPIEENHIPTPTVEDITPAEKEENPAIVPGPVSTETEDDKKSNDNNRMEDITVNSTNKDLEDNNKTSNKNSSNNNNNSKEKEETNSNGQHMESFWWAR